MAKLVKKTKKGPEPDFLPHTLLIAELAAKHKALDIRAYDVRELTVIADAFIICAAASDPQVKAIQNSVRKGMKEVGVAPLHTEGTPGVGWLILDYGSIILHVFRQEAREYYDLDGLWADAPQIDLGLEP